MPKMPKNAKNAKKPGFHAFWEAETTLAPQANLKPRWGDNRAHGRMRCATHVLVGSGPDHKLATARMTSSGLRVCVYPYCDITSQMGSKSTHLGVVSDPFFHVISRIHGLAGGPITRLAYVGICSKSTKKGQKCKKCQNPDFNDFSINQFKNDS